MIRITNKQITLFDEIIKGGNINEISQAWEYMKALAKTVNKDYNKMAEGGDKNGIP